MKSRDGKSQRRSEKRREEKVREEKRREEERQSKREEKRREEKRREEKRREEKRREEKRRRRRRRRRRKKEAGRRKKEEGRRKKQEGRRKKEKKKKKKRKREEERRSEKKKSQKKEDPIARKGRKVAKHCVFPMICGSGGSKGRLAKAAGAEPCGQIIDEKLHAFVARSTFPSQNTQKHLMFGPLLEGEMSKKCMPLWREAHFQAKMCKAPHVRSTLGSWDVEKVRAVVVRSTFRSQNVKSTTC